MQNNASAIRTAFRMIDFRFTVEDWTRSGAPVFRRKQMRNRDASELLGLLELPPKSKHPLPWEPVEKLRQSFCGESDALNVVVPPSQITEDMLSRRASLLHAPRSQPEQPQFFNRLLDFLGIKGWLIGPRSLPGSLLDCLFLYWH